MRTQEIEIGTYQEWKAENAEVANTILEKHRSINTDYNDWSDLVLEDFCNQATLKGFNVETDDISYSGFWSQGDGASFTGSIDILEYLKANKMLSSFKSLVRAINNDYISDTVSIERGSSNYSHENTCSTEEVDYYDYDALTYKMRQEIQEIQSILEDERLELCGSLYSNLEETYDELNSDENVIETLVANEYDFLEDGSIA